MKKNFDQSDPKTANLSSCPDRSLQHFFSFFDESNQLAWKTCLREIYFADKNSENPFLIDNTCHQAKFSLSDETSIEIFDGYEAEAFLAEVLCGLKSPLIGETEVLGQFKIWWKNLPENSKFKMKFKKRIELILNLVKSIREKALCGQGSQSYGSILRKKIQTGETVDILGAGHLAQEILPWLSKKHKVRLWVRDPFKVLEKEFSKAASQILPFTSDSQLSQSIVVAAPLTHEELTRFLRMKRVSSLSQFQNYSIYDLRADSESFQHPVPAQFHMKLPDFASQYAVDKHEIEKCAKNAFGLIRIWKEQQENQIQVRPFGWDDL